MGVGRELAPLMRLDEGGGGEEEVVATGRDGGGGDEPVVVVGGGEDGSGVGDGGGGDLSGGGGGGDKAEKKKNQVASHYTNQRKARKEGKTELYVMSKGCLGFVCAYQRRMRKRREGQPGHNSWGQQGGRRSLY